MSDSESNDEEPQYQVVYEEDGKKDKFLRRDGKATAKFVNDDTYIGDYKNGKRHGHGVYTWANGAKYEGDYYDGKKQGKGTFIAPDGGKYEGEWKDDKREGEGTYQFPNGDKYEGFWRNGFKHGKGKYYYSSIKATVDGDWSAGQLMDGKWVMHDGSKYMGKYGNNTPAGPGLYVFASGKSVSGQYAEGKWQEESFVPPSSDTAPPALVIPDHFKLACRAIDKCVVKLDHFEAIYRLKKELEGVPNYRKIPDFPVFGSGQPTLEGFRLMLEQIQELGLDRVVWFNMRNEPVIYVNNWSYAPRDKKVLNENLELNGLDVNQVHQLELRLAQKMKQEVSSRGGLHHYYKDTFAENPADRLNMLLHDTVKDLEHVRSMSQAYETLQEDDYDVTYHRLPIVDEKAPTLADFDNMVNILKEVDSNTAVCFNCQMGKGRTTTGTVIAVLMRRVLDEEGKLEEIEPVEFDENEPNYKQGQFKLIMQLVKAIPQGDLVKAEVDDAIDRCKAMQNLRECILYTKEMYDKETEDRRLFWKRMSINFIERYFYLIVFHAYLKLNFPDEFQVTFTQWAQVNQAIFEILGNRDTGALADFAWI